KKMNANYLIFNLGTGKGVSVLEAIQSFEKISGRKLNYKIGKKRAGDIGAIYSDTAVSEKELGWKTKFTLDEMIESAWTWQLNLELFEKELGT
ncbi:MAG TPA: UDP-glucose 4-epimerase GalE, partial [Bacteroidia bacterium]|nr:UDP-glucose 4-epimerase GalE [Bacteroidia bacterium]